MLFRNSQKINLTKLYFTFDKLSSEDIGDLITYFLKYKEGELTSYSLNYQDDKSISSFGNVINTFANEDFESLVFYNEDEEFQLSIDKMFAYLELSENIYECIFISSQDDMYNTEIGLITNFIYQKNLLYAYARQISSRVSPLTELEDHWFRRQKIKPDEESWLIHPNKLLDEGAAKGVYPLNYYKNMVFEEVCNMIKGIPGCDKHITGLVTLIEEEQQKQLLNLNPRYEAFIHF